MYCMHKKDIYFIIVCGRSFALTSTGPGWIMVFVVLCLGAPEGSTGSASGFKTSKKTGP